MLAKSIGTLTDLDPQRDLAATLQQAVLAAKQPFDADAAGIMLADADGQLRWASASDQRAQTLEDNQEVFAAGPCAEAFNSGRPAVMHDATLERRWGEVTLSFVGVQVRSGLSVPVELVGGRSGPWMSMGGPPRLGRLGGHRLAGLCRGDGQPARRRVPGRAQRCLGRSAPDRPGGSGAA